MIRPIGSSSIQAIAISFLLRACLISAVVVPSAYAAVCPGEAANPGIEQARAALRSGDAVRALEAYARIGGPGDGPMTCTRAAAQMGMGEALLQLGRFRDAKDVLERVAKQQVLAASPMMRAYALGLAGKARLVYTDTSDFSKEAYPYAALREKARLLAAIGYLAESQAAAAGRPEPEARRIGAASATLYADAVIRLRVAQTAVEAVQEKPEALSGAGAADPRALLTEAAGTAAADGAPGLAANAYLNLAQYLAKSKDWAGARSAIGQAQEQLARTPDSAEKADLLVFLGMMQIDSAELRPNGAGPEQTAGATFQKALDTSRKLGYRRGLAMSDAGLGRVEETLGDAALARADKERARSHYASALAQARKAIAGLLGVEMQELTYAFHWQAGRAQKKSLPLLDGASKAAAFAGALADYDRSVALVSTLRPEFLKDYRTQGGFNKVVGEIYLQYADLRLERSAGMDDPSSKRRALAETQRVVEQLKSVELQDFYGDECVIAIARKRKPIDEVLGQDGDRTAAIYPIILPDRLEVLLILPGGEIYQAPGYKVPEAQLRARINSAARRMSDLSRTASLMADMSDIYDMLVRPLEGELKKAEIDTLIFVPDGPLRRIPLGVLYDRTAGKQNWLKGFLINRYAVAVTPGLQLLDPEKFPRENISVLLTSLSKPREHRGIPFEALKFADAEVAEIAKIFTANKLQDGQFSFTTVESEFKRTAYRVVHMATHARFDAEPAKTFIVTAEDAITLDFLEQLLKLTGFRTNPVELLFLSACETAASGDDKQPYDDRQYERAALGLAGVAVKSGARSVVAALVQVDDAATKRLVVDFYTALKDPSISKAKALQQAQIKAIERGKKVTDLGHPRYWAPFLLIGNWL